MNFDLDPVLEDWPFDPDQMKVRRFIGDDGQEKIQLRLDLGLIQMNAAGRPDGKRPQGCESLFEWHRTRAEKAETAGEPFHLTPEECGELQQEAAQFHHRFVSLFQIKDFQGVVRDTQRNLDLFQFMARHSEQHEIVSAAQQVRPYVIMMNARARVSLELEREDHDAALRQIERGVEKIHDAYESGGMGELAAKNPEATFLEEWSHEIRSKKPISQIEQMRLDMEHAIAAEAYERAAELRDAIKAHDHSHGASQ